jgi:hypothetical protein
MKELSTLSGLKSVLIAYDWLFTTKSIIYFLSYYFPYLLNYNCSMFPKSKFLKNNNFLQKLGVLP